MTDTAKYEDFANLIRRQRIQRGMYRSDVTQAIYPEVNRISDRRIGRLESGHSKPDLEECAALGVELDIKISTMATTSGYLDEELAKSYDIIARSKLRRAMTAGADDFACAIALIGDVNADRADSLNRLADNLERFIRQILTTLAVD